MAQIKQTAKVAPRVKQVQGVDLQQKAERFKEIEKQLEKNELKIKPLVDERDDLKKEIIATVNATRGDDEEVELRTPFGDMKIGKRGSARDISDIEKAKELLGVETFMKIAKIGLTDLDKYLTPEQVAQVVEVRRTDVRRIT